MPASGQTFVKWTGDVDFANETAAETTFEMRDYAVTVTAIYKARITVVNGMADKTEAVEGETVTITAVEPPSGKVFESWTGNVEFVMTAA